MLHTSEPLFIDLCQERGSTAPILSGCVKHSPREGTGGAVNQVLRSLADTLEQERTKRRRKQQSSFEGKGKARKQSARSELPIFHILFGCSRSVDGGMAYLDPYHLLRTNVFFLLPDSTFVVTK